MEGFKPPKPLLSDGNIAERRKLWIEELEWYLVATESDDKPEKVRAGILLHCLGSKGFYKTVNFNEANDQLRLK